MSLSLVASSGEEPEDEEVVGKKKRKGDNSWNNQDSVSNRGGKAVEFPTPYCYPILQTSSWKQ